MQSSLTRLRGQVAAAFETYHGSPPAFFVTAPGRVNVIGEHVDYNEGLVLPAAIERWICAAVRPRSDGEIVLHDARLNSSATFSSRLLTAIPGRNWVNYVKGVLAGFSRLGHVTSGFEMTIYSTIPMGGGLSSSAALEATVALVVSHLGNLSLSRLELAKLCQQAEHEYAGVPCGLMDQASVLLCRQNELLMLDCQTNSVEFCPWNNPDWSLMIINSGVAHELASSEYSQRRANCHEAARLLGKPSLRYIQPADLGAALAHPALSDEMKRCVRHVVTENERTRTLMGALSQSDYMKAGEMLKGSHESLRKDYRVSCEELDFIADTANALEGVAGCRMTGGGFGGSAIALVQTAAAPQLQQKITSAYESKYGRKPDIFLTRPESGAQVWAMDTAEVAKK